MKSLRALKLAEGLPLTVQLLVYAPPELKELAGRAADEENIPLSEWVVRLMAEHFDRPDLAVIPRKRPGAKRKQLTA